MVLLKVLFYTCIVHTFHDIINCVVRTCLLRPVWHYLFLQQAEMHQWVALLLCVRKVLVSYLILRCVFHYFVDSPGKCNRN